MTTFDLTSADDEVLDGLPDGAWGRELRMNMSGCSIDFLADPLAAAEWARHLVDEIGMKPYGDPQIATFGQGVLFGNTVIQLIETSNIASFIPAVQVHANHRCRRRSAFVNVFSCKDFNVPAAIDFTSTAFGARRFTFTNDLRIAPPLED